MEHYTALVITRTRGHVPHNLGGEEVLPAAGEDVRGGVQAVALHGPELCASVRGLGVRGVGAVTTLCPGQAGLGPAHSHACVVTLVGSSSHAPGQPSPASPAQPSPADCRLVGQLLLSFCCPCTAQPSPGWRNTCVVCVVCMVSHLYPLSPRICCGGVTCHVSHCVAA